MWADYPAPVTLHKNFALLFIQSMSAKHTSIKTRTKNQQPESAHDVQDEQVSEVETPARKASLSAADAAYKKAAKSTARTPEKVAGSKNKEIPSPAPDKPEEPDDLLKKLDETQAQSKKNHELYLRAASDLDNYRRRVVREKEELHKYANCGLVEDLLPAIDNLTLGLESAQQHHPEAKSVIDGFSMVLTQIFKILEQHGIREINPDNGSFDPSRHECISHQPSDTVEEGRIITVTRKGYMLHERLVRPAGVVVSSGPEGKEDA